MVRLVVVDDEPVIRQGLGSIPWQDNLVSLAGIASNAEEAKALIDRTRPHIVLTDIRMPGTDGIDLAQEILRMFPGTRIILLTGHHRFEYAHRALKLSVTEFLLKPTDPDEIMDAVGRARDAVLLELGHDSWNQRFTSKNENVLHVLESIYVRYPERTFTLGNLANEMGVHPDHLSRLVSLETGINFSRLVREYRILQVSRLLVETNLRVSEIADATGFRDSQHLAHTFRAHQHATPTEFRRDHNERREKE